ncbi:acyl-CoA dehydratase activase-related protein [Chloroflexota bacterium]
MIKVGIPRALLYYQYYPMWQTFFAELGVVVVVSPSTNQAMLAAGSSRVVADTCLPAKVFIGHVLALADECDLIFVPAVRSVKARIYNCSKFLGLPDMTRAVVPEAPPILDIDIDINRGKLNLYRALYRLGRRFSLNPFRVKRAAEAAWQAHLDYRRLMSRDGLTPSQVMAKMSATPAAEPEKLPGHPGGEPLTIAVIGHPYLLYDEHINHRLIHRLEQTGSRVLTPEMVDGGQLAAATLRLTGRPYWTYDDEVVGAGGYYLENGIDGVIGVMVFGCGPDSLMMDAVYRWSGRLKNTPFMSLTIDEHTAEVGILTRLEAFLDMIQQRKRRPVCV